MTIHNIPLDRYKLYVTKGPNEKNRFLKNTAVFFRRCGFALRHGEIITDRKLADWAITNCETKSSKKLKKIAMEILPRVTKNKDSLQERYDNLNRHGKKERGRSSPEDGVGSERGSRRFDNDAEDDVNSEKDSRQFDDDEGVDVGFDRDSKQSDDDEGVEVSYERGSRQCDDDEGVDVGFDRDSKQSDDDERVDVSYERGARQLDEDAEEDGVGSRRNSTKFDLVVDDEELVSDRDARGFEGNGDDGVDSDHDPASASAEFDENIPSDLNNSADVHNSNEEVDGQPQIDIPVETKMKEPGNQDELASEEYEQPTEEEGQPDRDDRTGLDNPLSDLASHLDIVEGEPGNDLNIHPDEAEVPKQKTPHNKKGKDVIELPLQEEAGDTTLPPELNFEDLTKVVKPKSLKKALRDFRKANDLHKKVQCGHEIIRAHVNGEELDFKTAKKLHAELLRIRDMLNVEIEKEINEKKANEIEFDLYKVELEIRKISTLILFQEIEEAQVNLSESFDEVKALSYQKPPTWFDKIRGFNPLNFFGGTVRNFNELDAASANRVKASKYECLLYTVAQSLDGITPKKVKRDDILIINHIKDILLSTKTVDTELSSLEYLGKVRDAFEYDVLLGLRAAILLCEKDPCEVSPELRERVYKAVYDLYTSNDMDMQNKALLNMLTTYEGAKQYEEVADDLKAYPDGLFRRLQFTSLLIKGAPAALTTQVLNRVARSAKDYFSLGFSPIGAGNPPQVMDEVVLKAKGGQAHRIRIIGMGSPTIQGWVGKANAKIDPIFIGVQRHLEAREETHLYVSLQDARSDENRRNAPIMDLQNELPSLYAITLSKNTHFYEGGDNETMNKETFLRELHYQVFDGNVKKTGCFISPKVRDIVKEKAQKNAKFQEGYSEPMQDSGESDSSDLDGSGFIVIGQPEGNKDFSLEKTSQDILDGISQCLLASKTELTREERQHVIELYYTTLISYIAVTLEVDYANFTCKDGIDRGMGALAWFEFMFMVLNDNENSPKALETLQQVLFTRAYWTRKRDIIAHRKDRFIDGAMWLTERLEDPIVRANFKEHMSRFMPNVASTELTSFT